MRYFFDAASADGKVPIEAAYVGTAAPFDKKVVVKVVAKHF
jgi:hypothetical protein